MPIKLKKSQKAKLDSDYAKGLLPRNRDDVTEVSNYGKTLDMRYSEIKV